MDDNADTDVLLALLSSLLNKPVTDQSTLLDALVECNGDVDRAANLLNAGPSGCSRAHQDGKPKKRKRAKGLEQWIQRSPRKESITSNAGSSKRTRRRSLSADNARDDSHFVDNTNNTDVESSSKVTSSRTVSASSRTSPIKVKPLSKDEFLSVLRPPNSTESKTGPLRHPPLTLSTPQLVSKHTPCTIHTSILPPELACRLFYAMVNLAHEWDRNRWYLFERLVESPHKTCFFVRKYTADAPEWADEIDEATRFWYNGAAPKDRAPTFPPAMEEACKYVERVVNEEMHKRTRFPLEWGGEPPRGSDEEFAPEGGKKIIWRANVAASNCYEGAKETVGFHTDALTYLGPYPTIASLSLGTTRLFRLREVIPSDEKETRSARTFNIPMPHNSLTIMHASCQEMFKHSVPPQRTIDLFHPPFPPPPELLHVMPAPENGDTQPGSNVRINITFRFFRPDFRPSTTPKCKCGVPCVLRPDMKNRYTCDDDSPTKKSNETSTTGGDEKPTSSKRSAVAKYWWACNGGAQNEGKGCGMWKVMDVKTEGRGPFAGDGEL